MRRAALLVLLCACGVREPGIEVTVTVQVTPLDGLDDATLAIEKVELFECSTARWWRWLAPVSTAWAHGGDEGTSTPRVVTTPVLLDLRSAEVQPVVVVRPPPGKVCGLAFTFAPSTADAREQGTTLYVEQGSARQLSTKKLTVSRSFDALELDADHLDATLAWTLQMPTPGADGDATLQALLQSLQR